MGDIIDEITDAMEVVEGLPHPRWDVVAAWVQARCDGETDEEATWRLIVSAWLHRLRNALGEPYRVEANGRMSMLSAPRSTGPADLFKRVNSWMSHIRSLVPYEPTVLVGGPHVVILLEDPDTYYRYISRYYPDGSWIGSAGVCITEGYAHVVAREHPGGADSTIIHELTHVWAWELGMPLWLEEGLCQFLPQMILNSYTFSVNPEIVAKHKRFWPRQSLRGFWSGDDFGRPGMPSELSYHLAELLLRLIMSDHPRSFQRFLTAARWEDAGDAAAKEHLGRSLADIAATFLGPGNWSPPELSEQQRCAPDTPD